MFALGRVLSWMVTASTMLGAVAVICMMLQMVLDVVMKNLFNEPVPATTIFVAHYYMVIVAYVPMALAEKLDRHITVDVVFRHFSANVKKWLLGVIWLLTSVICVVIAHELWFEAMKKFEVGAYIVEKGEPIIIWPAYFALPLGFALLGLVLLYRFACSVTGLASGLGETPAIGHEHDEAEQGY